MSGGKRKFVEKITMTVDQDLVLHLARLAKLEIDGARAESLSHDLIDILAMVNKLDELELDGVEPLRYPTGVVQRLRPDCVDRHLDREAVLDNAPRRDGPYFRVPKVI